MMQPSTSQRKYLMFAFSGSMPIGAYRSNLTQGTSAVAAIAVAGAAELDSIAL